MEIEDKEILKKVWSFAWYVIMPIVVFYFIFNDLALNGMITYPSLLFFASSAIMNAIMDSIENEHILLTKFSRLNPSFWSKRESWKVAKMIGSYRIDAWHLAKSGMVIMLIFSIITYKPVYSFWFDFFLYGYWWNIIFNSFYSHLLKK